MSDLRPTYPIGYRTDCPPCGQPLEVVALGPASAPWVCHVCHRGFWAAELTDVARGLYRVRHHHDWGLGTPASAVRRSVQTEWLHAQVRGTSLRTDQLRHAHANHLRGVKRMPLSDEFAGELVAELEERG